MYITYISEHDDKYPFKSQEVAHAFSPTDGRAHFNNEYEFTVNISQGVCNQDFYIFYIDYN